MTNSFPSRWHFDRTGFPYFALPGSDSAMSLWPITKTQLELWLAEPDGPGDDWYLELLRQTPRGSWRVRKSQATWQWFFTAGLATEFSRFASWLGPGYRLPDASEWRAADRLLRQSPGEQLTNLEKIIASWPRCPAQGLAQGLWQSGRTTWPQLSLHDAGLLEWVTRPHGEPGGLGRPMRELPIQLILDPQAFEPVTLLRTERHPAFGARLIYSPSRGGGQL